MISEMTQVSFRATIYFVTRVEDQMHCVGRGNCSGLSTTELNVLLTETHQRQSSLTASKPSEPKVLYFPP